jgi:hypothetical protein
MTTPQNSDIETRKVPENQLADCFARFSKNFLMRESTNRVDVEILGEDLGDQFEAENTHLFGVTYDPKDKALDFELEGGDHRIFNPREVWVAEEFDGFITAIEVVRDDGTREIARVKRGAVVPLADARPPATENVQQTRPQ